LSSDVVIAAASGVCVGLVWVTVRLTRQFTAPHPFFATDDWVDKLSNNPASVLTSFDAGSSGLSPRTPAKLRLQRYRLLRAHLQRLESDFRLICTAIKVIAVESPRDRPDLVRLLLRSQITFAYGMMRVRFQLERFRFG
jgi:hypothetical protein